MSNLYPQRIICLTEESAELFHLLGRSDVIAGVSVFAKRPAEVKQHPIISTFTHANGKKIKDLSPDLIIGFSDIQKDIARDLIGEGHDVFITNQRSLDEIKKTMMMTANLIGEGEKARKLLNHFEEKIAYAQSQTLKRRKRFKVYLEEWDEPTICGIRWFSELVELCGGEDIFRSRSQTGSLARDRFVQFEEVRASNPDIILASWCGKKVDIEAIKNRPGFDQVNAVMNKQVFELAPEIFLQPGPALFVDGIDQLVNLFDSLN